MLGEHLLRVVARFNRWASQAAALPMPPAQARLLVLVEDLGPARISALAEADHCSQPTMSSQLKRLEAPGWIQRTADPEDHRACLVSLSPSGAEALAQVRRARFEAVAPLIDGLDADDLRRLAVANEVVTELLEKAAHEDDPDRKD